jgi:hypothetical protein
MSRADRREGILNFFLNINLYKLFVFCDKSVRDFFTVIQDEQIMVSKLLHLVSNIGKVKKGLHLEHCLL